MTLDERIEAGKVAARTAFYGPATFDQAMEAGIRAFAPELFTSPPTGWIAPDTATPEMVAAGMKVWDERMKGGHRSWPEMMEAVFEAARDAYLNREGK